MRHNGVAFPPEYEPRGLSVRIKGTISELNPDQEEMLLAWAKKIGTVYVDDTVFQVNFLASLQERWPAKFEGVHIADIDWDELRQIVDAEKLANLPPEKRKQVSAERKRLREDLKAKYGFAVVDDIQVEIGAYLVEPPGIFMGRGAHPMRGRWKPRVCSDEVTLNLDEEAPVPPPPHGAWKDIVHDHESLWVARWLDTLSNKMKYVWLAETSHLRQEREKEKFVKASHLEEYLDQIRYSIQEGMASDDARKRKVATVAYLIDKLAMRVGDEKDEDEADTVGATTLRVEHVRILPDKIVFDFLGKDSVPWEKTLPVDDENRLLAKNLQEFIEGKRRDSQIFPEIRSSHVNRFLGEAMPGLTAKVFRTFRATRTVRDYLNAHSRLNGASTSEKEHIAKLANLEAAIACNHKRTPPKTWAETIRKREDGVKKLRASKPDVQKLDEQIHARLQALTKLQKQYKDFQDVAAKRIEQKEAALSKLQARSKPKSRKARGELNRRLKAARQSLRELRQADAEKSKRYKDRIQKARETLNRSKETRQRAVGSYKERLEKAQRQLDLAKRTRDYNLNTSLKNYIDPRIYRTWGEQVGYDWTRLYSTALQRKFNWAKEATATDP